MDKKNLLSKNDPKIEKRLDEVRATFRIAFTEAIKKSGVEGLKRTSMFGRSHRRG